MGPRKARFHGCTLQAEAKAILEAEAAAPLSMSEARRIAQQWQQRLGGKVTGDSADLIREDRERCPDMNATLLYTSLSEMAAREAP